MANVKISALPNLANLASGTQFPVANAGNTFSVTSDTIKAYVVGTGFSVGNSIISNVAEPVANSDAATKSYVDSATSSGFTVQDDTANTTVVSGGDTLQLYGTANEVTVAITTTDRVTFGLPDNVTVTGNLGAGNLSGTNITGTLSTAAQTNITSVGTLTTLGVTGNVIAGNLNSNAAVTGTTGVFSGNVTGGNISTGGVIGATGNITGSYFLGNGSQLTGIDATAIQNGTSNVRVAASGNVTVSSAGTADVLTVTATGANIAGTLNTGTGNANVGNLGVTTVVATTLTGTLSTAAQPNITSTGALTSLSVTGNITGGNLLINTDAVITGNLTVQGNTTTINSNVITTNDLNITVGNNQSTGAALNNAGIDVGSNNLATWRFNNATTSWQSNIAVMPTANGTLTLGGTSNYWGAAYVTTLDATGNIAGGNLSGTNIVGTLTTAAQTNITSVGTLGSLSVTGNITSGNLSGTNIVGTLTTASQTNITSVGTLGSLSVTGNVSTGNVSGTAGTFTNVTGTLQTAAQTNITSVGTLGSLSVTGNASTGNVSGTAGTFTNVTGTLQTAAQTNVTSVGTLSGLTINNATIAITNGAANGSGNIGSSSGVFNTVFAKATSAQYADLAEKYTADTDYAPGTVVKFGGSAEITVCNNDHDPEIAGVVSTNPAYIMNAGLQGEHVVSVALTGRVPCHVRGPVRRGQMLVSAGNGLARAETHPAMGTVIGKALEDFNGDIGTIEAVVGRL